MIFHKVTPELAREMLASMAGVAKWDTSDGMCSIADIIGNADTFIAMQGEAALMAFSVQQVQHDHGRELVILVAMQIASGLDLTERVLPEIERVFGQGCDAATIHTRRAGLINKLEKTGYREAAKIMRKKLR